MTLSRRVCLLLAAVLAATSWACNSQSTNKNKANTAGKAASAPRSSKPSAEVRQQGLETPSPFATALAVRKELGPFANVYIEVFPLDHVSVLTAPYAMAGGVVHAGMAATAPAQAAVCWPLCPGRRRVLIDAEVCLQRGYLEHLLSRDASMKRHESVLSGDFDAEVIHIALLATGARPGRPVQFRDEKGEPAFHPPTGDRIRITLRYMQYVEAATERERLLSAAAMLTPLPFVPNAGCSTTLGLVNVVPTPFADRVKEVQVRAQRWVREFESKKELRHDWVFAGSYRIPDPEGNGSFYAANHGRVICVTNFTNALLDLPVESQGGDPRFGLEYEANTELIPPLGTQVIVILEPSRK